uniref:Uncharacterized protein n=1 Tax=Aegilops tauschii subsp. strangulata TaxID=200361 RepID=A0A453M5Q0_AEGTS
YSICFGPHSTRSAPGGRDVAISRTGEPQPQPQPRARASLPPARTPHSHTGSSPAVGRRGIGRRAMDP